MELQYAIQVFGVVPVVCRALLFPFVVSYHASFLPSQKLENQLQDNRQKQTHGSYSLLTLQKTAYAENVFGATV